MRVDRPHRFIFLYQIRLGGCLGFEKHSVAAIEEVTIIVPVIVLAVLVGVGSHGLKLVKILLYEYAQLIKPVRAREMLLPLA
jgi:hypothetical protein